MLALKEHHITQTKNQLTFQYNLQIIGHYLKGAQARAVFRYDMLLHPSAAGKLKKIFALVVGWVENPKTHA